MVHSLNITMMDVEGDLIFQVEKRKCNPWSTLFRTCSKWQVLVSFLGLLMLSIVTTWMRGSICSESMLTAHLTHKKKWYHFSLWCYQLPSKLSNCWFCMVLFRCFIDWEKVVIATFLHFGISWIGFLDQLHDISF